MIESIENSLVEAYRINYFQQLLEFSTNAGDTEELHQYMNTLELFAFGDLASYQKYNDKYITLTNQQVHKLLQLTVWDVLSRYDGGELQILDLSNNEAIRETIEQLGEYTNCDQFIEALLLEMNQELVSVVIDQQLGAIQVKEMVKLRDVFDSQLYTLRVLKSEDIGTLEDYKRELGRWLAGNIKSIPETYPKTEDNEKNDNDNDRPRKRKTSDNLQS